MASYGLLMSSSRQIHLLLITTSWLVAVPFIDAKDRDISSGFTFESDAGFTNTSQILTCSADRWSGEGSDGIRHRSRQTNHDPFGRSEIEIPKVTTGNVEISSEVPAAVHQMATKLTSTGEVEAVKRFGRFSASRK